MPAETILPTFESQFLIKIFLILFLLFYFFFSILLIRQVQIMSAAVKTDLNGVLKLAAFVNFVIATFFLALAFFA